MDNRTGHLRPHYPSAGFQPAFPATADPSAELLPKTATCLPTWVLNGNQKVKEAMEIMPIDPPSPAVLRDASNCNRFHLE
jgi:hypothetical protein